MLRRTEVCFPSRHWRWKDRVSNSEHRYREVNRWQRQASGTGHTGSALPQRASPREKRFNPEGALNTKGTSKEAWKWWHTNQRFLPNVKPKGYRAPRPMNRIPNAAWDEAFTQSVVSLSTPQLKERIIDRLTLVIFEESQRDGYELRKLDFEGHPLEALPEKRIIEQFVFEEETMRDRVLGQVVETDFRLAISSADRKELKSVENIVNYIVAYVTAAKPTKERFVTDAVRDVLAAQPVQPELGFQHALPIDSRDRLIVEWERMHQLDWQFGKAVYKPRSVEKQGANFEWLRAERENGQRAAFTSYVSSGRALADRKAKIAAAAGSE